MAYDYNQKGIWKVVYRLPANDSQFDQLNQSNWNDVVLEEQLKQSDFKEANELINRIKALK